MRLTRSAAAAAGLSGLLCAAAPAALAAPAPAAPAAVASSHVVSAVAVRGAIGQRYAALGGRAGFLGAPLADETPTYPRPGAFQNFQGGSIFWSVATGAWEVHGAIREAWFAQRAENGPLGFPTSNEIASRTRPGATSSFERGAVAWAPSTGAHTLKGAIYLSWNDQGAQGGALGWPTTDETTAQGTEPAAGAVRQEFQGASAYYSPDSGVGTVRGAIRARWLQFGGSASSLGLPVGNELKLASGITAQVFEAGVMDWTTSLGPVVVRVLGEATLHAATSSVTIRGMEAQPFDYSGSTDAFGSVSRDDPAEIVTPLTEQQFIDQVTRGARVAVTHDPATGRNVFTIVVNTPVGGPSTPSALGRYLARLP